MSSSSRSPVSTTTRAVAHGSGRHATRGLRNTAGANLRSAFEALWANRLRSLLTALGVIVGVAAVIGAVTLTESTSAVINSRIAGLGTNTLIITPGAAQSGGVFSAAGSRRTLTVADANAVGTVAHVTAVSPVITSTAQVIYSGQNWSTRALGVYPSYQQIGNWQLAQGAWFSSAAESSGLAQAVLGQTVEQNLFAASAVNPIGQSILINGQAFTVVGVLQAKGTSVGGNQDDIVYVPFSAAQTRLNNTQYVSQITAQVDNANNIATAEQEITTVLSERHNLAPGATADFTVRSSDQLVQTAQTFTQTLTFLLVGIAAISLIVGGIGIMNIMLVSVTERTREIGIRMAIGARRRDVRDQFLIEALTLSVAGGLIGILVGLGVGLGLVKSFGLPIALNPLPILLAFGVSAGIGVIFGLYPAVRASRLDPIVALRTE